jgi:hypothetical protein
MFGMQRKVLREPWRTFFVALALGPGLDTEVLRTRYRDELRPTLGRPDREDLTLELWLEMIAEIRGRARRP